MIVLSLICWIDTCELRLCGLGAALLPPSGPLNSGPSIHFLKVDQLFCMHEVNYPRIWGLGIRLASTGSSYQEFLPQRIAWCWRLEAIFKAYPGPIGPGDLGPTLSSLTES